MVPTSFPHMRLAEEFGIPYGVWCRYAESQMNYQKSDSSFHHRHYNNKQCWDATMEIMKYCSAQIFLSVNDELDALRMPT